MSKETPVDLRTTFDQVPDLYDRARPTYPAAVFDDLDDLTGLPAGARVAEIGCGTGQATIPMAERGWRVTCVELGATTAAYARRKLAHRADVEVINADFETWTPGRAGFDAIASFSAFHWLSQEARYQRTADLLADHGQLIIFSTAHVQPADGDRFFTDVQEDYEAVVPDDPLTIAGGPRPPEEIGELSDGVLLAELGGSGRYGHVRIRHYLWDVVYAADRYIDVLGTYSNHIAFDDDIKTRLTDRIRRRIEARPGGTVRKTYLGLLYVADRL
ncbi:MAG TPA: class I SAM-dependent methyltransferase [Acidimicrobiales bacterium]|jgi:SAM-dependent methyltransferase|nr:class I SAM-dependent methyltransferase [Acidimicrobiales bacterium]